MKRDLSSAGSAAGCCWAAQKGAWARPKRIIAVAGLVTMTALSAASLAANRVSIQLEGEIGRECAILNSPAAGGAPLGVVDDVGDIRRPGHKVFGFAVNCNTPFEYHIEAQYGALTHKTQRQAPLGFLTAIPYDVSVHIPTDAAAIDDRCPGESIRAGAVRCAFSDSGNGIALGTLGQLTLAWAPKGVPVAGEYSDMLTITVTAKP